MSNIVEAPENRNEFKQFIKENTNKHIILYATATWCKPCEKSKPYIYQLFEQYKNPNKLLVLLDVDKCKDTANSLRIRSIPTLIYYHNGEPTDVVLGGNIENIISFFKKLK